MVPAGTLAIAADFAGSQFAVVELAAVAAVVSEIGSDWPPNRRARLF